MTPVRVATMDIGMPSSIRSGKLPSRTSRPAAEGLNPKKTFFGLTMEGQVDVVLFLVEEHLSRHILEEIGREGEMDEREGAGVAFQIDLEDAVGLSRQIENIQREIQDEL